MAKKGPVQLQTEINTEEEWEKFILKDGLLVIDVYSDWCGPCAGMLGNLKKLKLEIGGDNLNLAVAKADNISCLERFRNKSEPTWMFISDGKMVNLMFGANAPKLMDIITDMLNKEIKYQDGEYEWDFMEFTDLTEEEEARLAVKTKIEEEAARVEAEAAKQAQKERKTEVAEVLSMELRGATFILFWPHADEANAALAERWDPLGLQMAEMCSRVMDEEILQELMFFSETELSEAAIEALFFGTAFVQVLRAENSDLLTDTIESIVCKELYGQSKKFPGAKECPANEYMKTVGEIFRESNEVEGSEDYNTVVSLAASKATVNTRAKSVKSVKEIETKDEKDIDEADEGSKRTSKKDANEDSISGEGKLRDNNETVPGLWTPENKYAKSLGMYAFFPVQIKPLVPPEPEPKPPCVAVVFDAYKRTEICNAIEDYKNSIIHMGFFTSGIPGEAKLVAKSVEQYDKIVNTDYGEKMVLQVAKKLSEPLLTLSTLGPTYISVNTVEGEKECKIFFPEDFDKEPEAEEEPTEEAGEKGDEDEEAKSGNEDDEEGTIVPETEEEVSIPGDVVGPPAESTELEETEADKATSPMAGANEEG